MGGHAYAERFLDRVTELILFSVTNTTQHEVDWMTRQMGQLFLKHWDRFLAGVPETDRDGDLSAAYTRLLSDSDLGVRQRAARD